MARHHFLVLTFALFLSHCAVDLPVDYYISSSCYPDENDSADAAALKEAEVQAIIDGVQMWNDATCMEMFRFQGIYRDGWFTLSDLADDKRVVYCVEDTENPDINRILAEGEDPDLVVAYSIADIFIRRQAVLESAAGRWIVMYQQSTPLPADYYLKIFKMVASHEFGHQINLGHNNDLGYSIMPSGCFASFQTYSPSKLDIYGNRRVDGVCDFYNCPPADECPTRPTL